LLLKVNSQKNGQKYTTLSLYTQNTAIACVLFHSGNLSSVITAQQALEKSQVSSQEETHPKNLLENISISLNVEPPNSVQFI
jgi:hypothetical protein